MDELSRKVAEDIRQQIMRQCFAALDEKLHLKAIADEEKRKKEREEKARQEAEKPSNHLIADMMVSDLLLFSRKLSICDVLWNSDGAQKCTNSPFFSSFLLEMYMKYFTF